MSLSSADIAAIVEALHAAGWDQAVVQVGDVRIAVAHNGAPLASELGSQVPSLSPAGPVLPEDPSDFPVSNEAARGVPVLSPSVGIFWRSPEPGAAPFVDEGAHVNVGDIVGIVEVMKLMLNVSAPVAGVVGRIHVANGAEVSIDSPLLTIDPRATS